MPILNVNVNQAGQAGVFPAIIYILTNDTLTQVTQTGYLNGIIDQSVPLADSDIALVTTKTSQNARTTQIGWFAISHSGGNWSLVNTTSSGSVILPTTPNHIGTYINTVGALSQDAPTAINGGNIQAGLSGTAGNLISFPALASAGSLVLSASPNLLGNGTITITNADSAGSRTFTIPDGGQPASNFIISDSTSQQLITSGSLILLNGNIGTLQGTVFAGSNGEAGNVVISPSTINTGSLQIVATPNSGNNQITITNAPMGQSSTIAIPDPGTSNTHFILSNFSGVQQISTGSLQIGTGSLSVGNALGTAGSLISYPSSANNGGLIVAASNAGANFNTTITNSTMGQSTTYSIPDIGASTGGIVVSPSAIRMKSVANVSIPGTGAIRTIVDTFCTTSSAVVGNCTTESNLVNLLFVSAGNGFITLSFSGDPGTAAFSYIITK